MKADIFYSTLAGRVLFKALQKTGFFRLASWFLHTRASRFMIPGYIKKNRIDMRPFEGQTYRSFADFFVRKRDDIHIVSDPDVLISPCDGLLSVYPVTADLSIPMKGSVYNVADLVPDKETADLFQDGLCLVFRLEASDYHHFCCFDDGLLVQTDFIQGQLHSVQPIAHRSVPVYRLNRRWWSVLETKHFGTAVQIEVGAVLVGGVTFSIGKDCFCRGDEMGCFELAGSTIILLLNSSVRQRLVFSSALSQAAAGKSEARVRIGSTIGMMTYENLQHEAKSPAADQCSAV